MSAARRVLFLCTGNSCRSQLAEAITNARFPSWQASSAGVRPSGTVHPMTIQVLREMGIEHRGISRSVDDLRDQDFDLVVTVCDDANEDCPIWLGRGKRLHQSFLDPAGAVGTDAERLAIFRHVRDQISERLAGMLE